MTNPRGEGFLTLTLQHLRVRRFTSGKANTMKVIRNVEVVPSTPITPMEDVPMTEVIPPPFKASMINRMVNASSVTCLRTGINFFPIVRASMTTTIRIDGVDTRGFLNVLVFPMFNIFLVASSRGTIQRMVDFRNFRVHLLIVINVGRVVVIRLVRIEIFFTEYGHRYGSHWW